MTFIHIKGFRGKLPRVSERALAPNQARRADNLKITSGRIDPLAGLSLVFSNSHPIRTAYRYRVFRNDAFESNWLTWPTDVDVVPSLVPTDTLGRFYFTGDGYEPRMSSYAAAIAGGSYPAAWFALGVCPAAAAPSLTTAGGGSSPETRSYVTTFVTALGEESPPSPPSAEVAGHTNGTWTLNSMQLPPVNSGTISAAVNLGTGRVRVTLNTVYGIAQYDTLALSGVAGMTSLNGTFRVLVVNTASNYIEVALQTGQTYTSGGAWAKKAPHNTSGMTRRIYRTTGTAGVFLFVAEIAASTVSYVDAVAASSLGEELPTATSQLPPKNMVGLISLPNGCLVGIAGNEVCFSEPYMPYSWPIANRYSFSGQGVALVSAGNSVIVLTDTYPILITGTDPESMSPSTLETYAPCVSKRGVVNAGAAAVYPSFDGLWLAAPGRVDCLTRKLYREEEWSQINPASFDAAFHDGQYYASYVGAEENRILVVDINEPDSVVEVDEVVDCLYRNELDGKLYASKGAKLYEWDSDLGHAYDVDWMSSDVQVSKPINFTVAQVHADFNAITPVDTTQLDANVALIALGADAVAGHIDGHELLSVELNGSYIVPVELDDPKQIQFTLYSNGSPVFTTQVVSGAPFRLPSGFLTELVNLGVHTSVKVYSITIADSVEELARASA